MYSELWFSNDWQVENKIDCSKSLNEANLKSLVEIDAYSFSRTVCKWGWHKHKYSQTYNPMIHLQFQVGADS